MSESTPDVATQSGDELLLELADDYLRRCRAGEQPTVDEYASKHPELADRIRELFPAMIAMEQSGPGATVDSAPPTERVGATIGRYKLLERIGEGGFGVVYMAEQQHPVRRKVALKVIKPGVDTRQVIARFEAERQALALMEHENIARVLDAGATDSGRPYFVMELVHGVPITEFCDGNQLSPRERLELFVPVCRAVQHAHTKGIIHRDIKPTNVLVTLNEGVPVPKVIDFGVAKAAGQQLTEKTLFTNFAQMVGTPLYMSPEQAEMTSIDVDTRSDVYSLGVLLYELLTGTTPLDSERLKRAAFDEVRRIIREEEPPRPSTRLSTMGEEVKTISVRRKSDPFQLGRLVRGELDWIVMKALEKDRRRRYETASGLARDIEHYLNDEPVQAFPPSAMYRFRKFAGRNRGALAAVSVTAASLLLATVISVWHAQQTEVQRQLAQQSADQARGEAAKSNAVVMLLQEMLAAANPDSASGKDYTLRDLLDKFSARLDNQLAEQPEVEATLRQIIGSAYTRLKLVDEAEPHLRRALELRRQIFGEQHVKYADSLRDLAWNILEKSRASSEVEALARKALAIYRKQNDPDGEIRALWLLVLSADGQSKLDEAEAAAEETLRLAREQNLEGHSDIPNILHHLAWIKCRLGMPAAAEPLAREAVERHMQVHGEGHPETAFGWQNLGIALRAQGKYAAAAESFRKALETFRQQFPEDHHFVRTSWISIIETLQLQENVPALEGLKANSPEALQPSIAQALGNVRLELARRKENDALQRQAEELVGEMGHYFRRIRRSATGDDPYDQSSGMPQPLFVYHYSRILAGSLWGLVDSGRPTALVAVELYPAAQGLTLQYELTSLSSHSLDLEVPVPDGMRRVQHRGITLQELPHAMAPEQNAGARLGQMQAIVQRMTSWLAGTSPVALHVLPRPIHRYSTSGDGLIDGAIFLFCHEANPEFALILEAHKPNTWRFGVARISELPRIALHFDGQIIWTSMPTPNNYSVISLPITRRDASRFSAIYTVAVSRQPNAASAHRGLGYALAAEGRWSEAIASHREALRIEPYDASLCNSVAWHLATAHEEALRDIDGALALANQGVELAPADGNIWNTLGVAQYRADDWKAAIETFNKSMELREGGDSMDWFFLAMAECKLGNKDAARPWYNKAVGWMEEKAPNDEELIRFRAEAAELLGLNEKPESKPSSTSTQ